MTAPIWHLLTGEYPPQPGGVSDYTAQLAAALAAGGAEVHVWTTGEDVIAGPGVAVHRSAGRWSTLDLARLSTALDAFPSPRRLLAQHVPPLWGYRGLNLGFGRWLLQRRVQGDDVRVMFHEVRYHTRLFDKPTRWLLAAVQWRLVRDMLAASTQVYVSTPSWEPLLRRHGAPGRRAPVTWLPVPSNIPVIADPTGVAALRRRFAPEGEVVVGTFGTFSGAVAALLAQSLPCLLLEHPSRRALLLGRGGDRFAEQTIAAHPSLAGQLDAPGPLPAADVSRYLQACDVIVQPYPDGVTSRRTSTMAALAHGRAVVTNAGALAEPFWADSRAVALAPSPDSAGLVRAAEALLADPAARSRLGAEGRQFYERSFAIERTVETLLRPVCERGGCPE
ncbi:MAG: glycosyltransferase family 4 protein [Isosphaeraceae bacterium]|nr:glycosyltransferase family 4 protein [Isosphaeraceae bacterium]